MLELSPYLLAIAIAWVAAQGGKYFIQVFKTKSLASFRQLYLSGNMPSSHSAATVALTTLIGMRGGIDTAIFAISALFAAIVMYDAVMVRRSSGEQGAAIRALIKEQKSKVALPRAAKGHEPLEVVVGAALGFAVGLAIFLLTS